MTTHAISSFPRPPCQFCRQPSSRAITRKLDGKVVLICEECLQLAKLFRDVWKIPLTVEV